MPQNKKAEIVEYLLALVLIICYTCVESLKNMLKYARIFLFILFCGPIIFSSAFLFGCENTYHEPSSLPPQNEQTSPSGDNSNKPPVIPPENNSSDENQSENQQLKDASDTLVTWLCENGVLYLSPIDVITSIKDDKASFKVNIDDLQDLDMLSVFYPEYFVIDYPLYDEFSFSFELKDNFVTFIISQK